MDSSPGVILCIFTLIALSSIRSVSSKYVPLYLAMDVDDSFELIYDVYQDAETKQYMVKGAGRDILAACPLVEGPQLYKIEKIEWGKTSLPITEICENPVKSRIHDARNEDGANSIGFAVLPTISEELLVEKAKSYDGDSSSAELLPDHLMEDSEEDDSDQEQPTPQELDDKPDENLSDKVQTTLEEQNDMSHGDNVDKNKTKYDLVELIVFKFDDSLKRIKYTWHRIEPGKLLKPEITRTGKEAYQKNTGIYGFDVDDVLYKKPSPFFKVQLSPEEDFFFESWKTASRQNILTAPMWVGLQSQWQNMEILIRQVTQIIGSIEVKTGVSGIQQVHEEIYSVPKFFWKSVFIDFVYERKRYQQGILFVLPNLIDSHEVFDENEICPEDEEAISKTGWTDFIGEKSTVSMQVCLSNTKNMKSLFEGPNYDYEALNLNAVPVKQVDDEGITESVITINVLEKLKEL